jgi:hypothetical protein
MPSPNPSYGDLLSTTMQDLEDELFDNILTKNALSATLKEYGAVGTRDGAPQIVIPIEYAENGSYTRYSGSGILNTTINEVFTSFVFPWSQAALNVQINGKEMLQNSGRSQNRALLASRVKNAKHTFENQFNVDLLSDGAAANQLVGLQTLISATGAGTVGGVSRSAYSFAQNQFYRCTTDGGVAVSSSNIVGYMDLLDLRIQAYRGKTKVIMADDTMFRLYESAVHPLQRLSNGDKGALGKLGFNTYAYKQAEMVFEPTASGMPASTQYWIDPDCMELISHSDRNLVQLPKRESFNQDLSISYLAWMGALTVKNFRRLGTLNNL